MINTTLIPATTIERMTPSLDHLEESYRLLEYVVQHHHACYKIGVPLQKVLGALTHEFLHYHAVFTSFNSVSDYASRKEKISV